MSRYDIVIAGAGLAGLECAAILSKEGMNVCVLEKNPLLGGCFQSFPRNGKLLDTGIHYVGGLDEGELLHTIFKYLGIMGKLHYKKLDANGFDRIHIGDKLYRYAMGHDNFVETLAQDFPHAREELKRYSNAIRAIGNTSSTTLLRQGIFSDGGYKYFARSASAFINETVSDPLLRLVLAGTGQLYGATYDCSPLYCHAMINNSYISGAFRFIGGSMQVTDALADVIRGNGGTVRNNSKVTRFITDGVRVKAVCVNGDEIIEADRFISTLHPAATLPLIDDTPLLKKAYKRRITSLPNGYGVFTIYLFMKPGSYPYENFNRFVHNTDDIWYNGQHPFHGCLISQQVNSENQRHADIITILTPMPYSEVQQWENTTVEHRGDSYRAFKEQKTRAILGYIARHGISYGDAIDHIATSSPLTYRDYTATPQGAAYGIVKDYKTPYLSIISPRTHLSNFFFAGQNLNVHGALGVSLTSLLTCAEFVGQEYLSKKVGNA